MRAKLAGLITSGELDSIKAECNDSTKALERDEYLAYQMGCQTRVALNRGVASCL